MEEDTEEGEEAKVAVEGDAKKNVKLFKVRLRTIDLVYYLSLTCLVFLAPRLAICVLFKVMN